MPPKRSNTSRRARKTQQQKDARSRESEEHRTQRNELNQIRTAQARANATNEQNALRRENNQLNMKRTRANLADENRQLTDRVQRQTHRTRNIASFDLIAFEYNHEIDYASHPFVTIGPMNKLCPHCNALKFINETPGMCCANGKVKLPELNSPPEPLSTLVSG